MEKQAHCDRTSPVFSSEPYPSFFKNSCTGTESIQEQETTLEREDNRSKENESGVANQALRPEISDASLCKDDKGWTIELSKMPKFTEDSLNKKLIEASETMPDKVAPKAYRNKMQGYKLWKEGYVSRVRVKPGITAGLVTLCLAKASVSASMKSVKYTVYCHMNQDTAEVVYAKCNCKAGQGGCCKHVAALLYTLLDFSNLDLSYVPEDVTCTQVLQKWSMPSKKLTGNVAVKFSDLEFEKIDYAKDKSVKRKRPVLTGNRDDYCATPLFAREVTKEDIRKLSEAFEAAGKATLFVASLKGNDYSPCTMFETSCTRNNDDEDSNIARESGSSTRVDVFDKMSAQIEINGLDIETTEKIKQTVGVTVEQCHMIEAETRGQSSSQIWFHERSKRITASMFGRVLNRREKIFPKSIIDTLRKTRDGKKVYAASLEWGTEKEKVALDIYQKNHCQSDLQVIESGLIINPQWPWLGASPDGLLVTGGRAVGGIEIKCPFSKKDETVIDACRDKKFFMEMSATGPTLKESHAYSYQCQGVMNIVGLDWLDFVVYTEKDLHVQRLIRKKQLWNETMLPKLTKFYKDFLLDLL